MNQYDVLRYLIRNTGHASGAAERDLLLAVDAAEQGYPDLESYKEVVQQKEREEAAARAAETAGPQQPADVTAGLDDDALEAELERRKALKKAQEGKRETKAAPKATKG